MILGANIRTSLTGIGAALFSILTVVAALPYEQGGLADIFPPTWKSKIMIAAAISAFALKVWNSILMKDKDVTGGTTQQTASGAVANAGTQTMVDQTIVASIASNSPVTEAQRAAVQPNGFKLPAK